MIGSCVVNELFKNYSLMLKPMSLKNNDNTSDRNPSSRMIPLYIWFISDMLQTSLLHGATTCQTFWEYRQHVSSLHTVPQLMSDQCFLIIRLLDSVYMQMTFQLCSYACVQLCLSYFFVGNTTSHVKNRDPVLDQPIYTTDQHGST